jgi:hypothetical protein
MSFVLYWSSKNLSCDSWSLGTDLGTETYLRHSAKVSKLLQKFTEYAGFWTLEDIFTWEVGVVQISSMLSVLRVLQNNLFDVNDLEEAADKFNFGVNVDDNDTVEGVNTAFVWDRFDFLPTFLGVFSGKNNQLTVSYSFFSDFGIMMTLISLR